MFGIWKSGTVFFIVLLLPGCNDSASSNNNRISNSLEYFGFAVVDCGWDDPNDNTIKTNYVDEVSGFSNVGQMCASAPDESIIDRIAVFKKFGVKAVLNVEPLLFERIEDVSSPSDWSVTLRKDARALWAAFVKLNSEVLVPQNIAALYIVDEPVWNGVSESDFTRALQIVKATIPDIPTFSIEAHPAVSQILVPDMLDWVGFDRYVPNDPVTDSVWHDSLEKVRGALSRSDQKIVIVAGMQWLPSYQSDAGISPEDMEAMIYSYYHIAASDPDVVALAGYIWPGGLDHPAQLGARNLPENVQKAIRAIGRKIITLNQTDLQTNSHESSYGHDAYSTH